LTTYTYISKYSLVGWKKKKRKKSYGTNSPRKGRGSHRDGCGGATQYDITQNMNIQLKHAVIAHDITIYIEKAKSTPK
jgi:hypothetical protein